MKTHAIIPIFIPHIGCPHDCAFCNQRQITAQTSAPTVTYIEKIILRNLGTIEPRGIAEVEIAYFGGSFTGLSIDEQNYLLTPAIHYKAQGRVSRIRLSTRPDYIDDSIISNLKAHSVDIVELGVQSFDDEVLSNADRGHDADSSMAAFGLLKDAGFEVVIQLMAGLPGSTPAKDILSAEKTAELKPTGARIYPTVILKDTTLSAMYASGTYIPPSQGEMVETVKQMYLTLQDAGVRVLRVGLKSTDIISQSGDSISGSYHPAFRELVEASIARDRIEAQMGKLTDMSKTMGHLTIYSHPKYISCAAGHGGSNRNYLAAKYPDFKIRFISDSAISEGEYIVKLK